MTHVHVDFRKWPDAPHWQLSMHRLGEDEHGIWLWAPAGGVVRRGEEPPRVARSLYVKLIKQDAWWTAIWNAGGRFECYVDIATPAQWDGDRVMMIDLDLDVARFRDGSVAVLDEDEFAEHQQTLGYPPELVDRARTTTAAVFLGVERREPPFDATGADWLRRAAAIAET